MYNWRLDSNGSLGMTLVSMSWAASLPRYKLLENLRFITPLTVTLTATIEAHNNRWTLNHNFITVNDLSAYNVALAGLA